MGLMLMRLAMMVVLLTFSAFVVAQMPAGMQEAIDCMESIDQDELQGLGRQGEKVGKEIEALCKDGDDAGAMEVALAYAKDMEGNEAVAELTRCSEMMREVMPNMPIPEIPSAEQFKEEAGNICENVN